MCIYSIEKDEDMGKLDWEHLKKGDILQIKSIQNLADEPTQVKEIIKRISELEVELKFSDTFYFIEPEILLSLLKTYDDMKAEELRKRQYVGIRKALAMKKEGRGTYGRPKTHLPEDFEEKVIDCIESGCCLSQYRKETELPQSTFYKYANKIIEKYNGSYKQGDRAK